MCYPVCLRILCYLRKCNREDLITLSSLFFTISVKVAVCLSVAPVLKFIDLWILDGYIDLLRLT